MSNDPLEIDKIISLIPGNVYWKNRDGYYLGCNDACAKCLGFSSSKEIVGKTIYDILDNKFHDFAEKIHMNDNEIMENNTPRVLEEKGPDAQGKVASYLTKKTPLHDEFGNVIGLLGVSIDFSSWKNVEAELLYQINQSEKNREITNTYLSNMLANLPENFYWVDRDSNVLGCNENQAKFFGLKSSKELIGKSIYDVAKLIGKDKVDADKIRQNDIEVMETRKTTKFEEEIEINGETKTFISFKNPLIDHNDEVIGVFGVTVDITERKNAEKALIEALKKAEAANIAKSNFIRNMSHDLRTPFGGILGFASHLEYIEDNPDKKEKLGYIKQSCEKLLSLINEIINLTSIETGEQLIQFEQTNIQEVINDINVLMTAQLRYKNLEFNSNVHNNLSAAISVDKTRLHRILLNLVSNAIKFTAKGSVSIEAFLSEIDTENKQATLNIHITDTGIGIPEDKLDVIFDRFTRLTNSYESNYEGTGLGLYIVKQLIKECGGSITVESKLNCGSKFICKIPCKLI